MSRTRLTAATAAALLALVGTPAGATDLDDLRSQVLDSVRDGAVATGATADPDGDDPSVSDGLDWVANLQYPVADTNSRTSRTDVQGGTDLELTTLLVPERDDDGDDDEGGSVDLDDLEPRDYAIAGTYENGLQIVDVTDPTDPQLAAAYGCDVYQGDVQVFTRDDLRTAEGLPRTFATFAVDYSADLSSQCFTDLPAGVTGGVGSLIVDVTDPTDPRSVSFVRATGGTHNMTVHPDGELLYNSENDAGGRLQVFDIAGQKLFAPELVTSLEIVDGGTDTHDVTFDDLDPTDDNGGDRAYVASITNSYVLDTSDPRDPVLISRIADPAIGIHHQADPIEVAHPVTGAPSRFLIISDEIAGAAGNGYCPGGGLHVFDITGALEQAPVKVGAYFMPDLTVQEGAGTGAAGLVSCTAHVFRMYADQQVMTIGNMAGGVRVLDLSNLIGVSVGPRPAASTGAVAGIRDLGYHRFSAGDVRGSDAWAFKAHPDRFEEDGSFYAFSNDQTRGFEVFRFEASEAIGAGASPDGAPDGEVGRWASVEQALQRARWIAPLRGTDALLSSCRLVGLPGAEQARRLGAGGI